MNKECFHLFTGKGGTGKTTLSSAASIYYAKKGKKTLVASIDPAHSLSDCFGIDITNEPTKITRNLFGIEIDAGNALEHQGRFAACFQLQKGGELRGLRIIKSMKKGII